VPGKTNQMSVLVDRPGRYDGACTQYCGLQHAWMRIRVVADSPAAFAAWEQQQLHPAAAATGATATRGQKLYQELTCVRCHAIAGVTPPLSVAPDLTHFAGRATLAAGVLANNPANLAAWLADPQAIKPGSHMPNLRLTDAQVADLVAYFETLR